MLNRILRIAAASFMIAGLMTGSAFAAEVFDGPGSGGGYGKLMDGPGLGGGYLQANVLGGPGTNVPYLR